MNNKKNMPEHIAIIMDGNGRWAKEKNLHRTAGHKQGVDAVRNITRHCSKIGIKYLTLYAFSTENWNRPKIEVDFLMMLMESYIKNEVEEYLAYDTKFRAIGDTSKFPESLQKVIKDTQEKTAHSKGLTQILALNYGSQDEILRAVKKIKEKDLEITKENFELCLDTANMPNVDILIRTSGEVRLSNFLLWQNAYAEMFFTNTNWPEFTPSALDDIISDFMNRERRFGAI